MCTSACKLAILTAALSSMACASGAGPKESVTRPTSTPKGRICVAASRPEVLPSTASLLDSMGLARTLRGISPAAGHSVQSVAFTDQSQLMWARIIETNLDSMQSRPMLAAVVAHLRPQLSVASWVLRVRTMIGETATIQLERSEICPAMPYPGSIDIVTTSRVVSSGSSTDAPRFETPRFTVHVDSAGRVRELRLTQSSGELDIDRQFQAWLQNHRFYPSLVDGYAVDMWVAWPVQSQ